MYPDDYSYQGGGYFNPLESTLPRGMYQAVNPLKDYGYPSDFGLPMASMASSCYITSNPLSELEENTTQRQQATPQILAKTNLSNSSTASAASTLSPLRGHLSSSGIVGDLSTASGNNPLIFLRISSTFLFSFLV